MSEILKTEAIVLKKMDYRESSKIAVLYTKEHGKISAIIKGARSAKSLIGKKIDILNYLQIVVYLKSSRDLQILTQAEILEHYFTLKEDIGKIKYAYAVIEILNELTIENDANERLFNGTIKILKLIQETSAPPQILLIKYILFLLKESGYELVLNFCNMCGNEINNSRGYFNADKGIICYECIEGLFQSYNFSRELFNLLLSLSNKNDIKQYHITDLNKALDFLEKYMQYHIPEFKGIRSIHLY